MAQLVCGQKMKKGLETSSIMYHLDGLEGKKARLFDNEEHLAQFLKMFFLRNLFTWVKKYIEIDSMSLIDFIEWLSLG